MKYRYNTNTIILCSLLLSLSLIMTSCTSTNNSTKKEKKTNRELSPNAINKFNKVFHNVSLDGNYHNFISGVYLPNPKINYEFVSNEKLSNILFFKLKDNKGRERVISVNLKGCFASIPYKLNGYIYPNQYVIFPSNFSFLNDENLNIKPIKCKNKDELKVREVSYEKDIIKKWKLDSINRDRLAYKPEVKLLTLQFRKNYVLINDTLKKKYINKGYNLKLKNSNFSFFKVFINAKHMILINIYKDSFVLFYFSAIPSDFE